MRWFLVYPHGVGQTRGLPSDNKDSLGTLWKKIVNMVGLIQPPVFNEQALK